MGAAARPTGRGPAVIRTVRFYVRNTQSSASVARRAQHVICSGAARFAGGAAPAERCILSWLIAASTTIKTVMQASIDVPGVGTEPGVPVVGVAKAWAAATEDRLN